MPPTRRVDGDGARARATEDLVDADAKHMLVPEGLEQRLELRQGRGCSVRRLVLDVEEPNAVTVKGPRAQDGELELLDVDGDIVDYGHVARRTVAREQQARRRHAYLDGARDNALALQEGIVDSGGVER